MRTNYFNKRALVSVLSLLSFMSVAGAQVPSVSPPPFQPNTYRAAVTTLAAPQTGAGDLLCIKGSASKLVKVKQIVLSGSKTTAQSYGFALIKRSAANTGGTSTAPTNVPLDSTFAAATAVLAAYTAVPTPGTAVGNVGARQLTFATATAPTTTWSWDVAQLYSDVRLRGVAESLCINAPVAFTTDGPTLSIEVTWIEQ